RDERLAAGDGDGRVALDRRSVADVAIDVVAPAERGAGARDAAGMRLAGADRDELLAAAHRRRRRTIRRIPVAKPALEPRAPTVGGAAAGQRAEQFRRGNDRLEVEAPGDRCRRRDVCASRRSIADLADEVESPTGRGAVDAQPARCLESPGE